MSRLHIHHSVSSRKLSLFCTLVLCTLWTVGLVWALDVPTRAAELDGAWAVDLDRTSGEASLALNDGVALSRVTQSITDGTAELILTGSQSSERLGAYAMDSAGDVNGDGYIDIVVGSSRYDIPDNVFTDEGVAFIYYGLASGVAATPGVTLTLPIEVAKNNINFGRSVAGLGDVNGDGYDDIAVGAGYCDAPTNNEGLISVYYGSPSGISESPSITYTGPTTETYLGWDVAGAGDVNGDGYDDLIAAAVGYDHGEEDEGAAFVYYGSAMGLGASPAMILESNTALAEIRSVAGAGDVNGDGYADVLIGSFRYNTNDGIAYVFQGSAVGINPSPAVTLTTPQSDDRFGVGLDGAGDVNGDGYADVVIGAEFYNNGQSAEGAFFVYHGSASGIDFTPTVTVESNLVDAFMGNAVAGVGDVDGDGYADLLVGARSYDSPSSNSGAAFLYQGAMDGIDADNRVWLSPVIGGQYGYDVAAAGDVNGDGYADIMVGQDIYPIPFFEAGAIYIYHGGGDDLQSDAAWTATGEASGNYFGKVASAGDVNGDGFSDAIIGAYGYMTDTGRAYLYLGAEDGLGATPALTLTGENEGDRLGLFVSTAGDVNGDGYADILVGASGYMTNTGQVYLYLGSPTDPSATPAMTLTGENEQDYFGRVSSAGDVNGDGYADVLVSANNYPGGARQGKMYLYYGSATGLGATPAFSLTGETVGDNFAVSLDTAGDVNGDGYADVVVGADRHDGGVGAIYVYHGGADGLSATPDFTATGEISDARFGVAVGTAGDVNGDGYSDVVVGAEYDSSSSYQAGRAYVFAGSASGLDATPVFDESDAPQIYGHDVSSAGDVNGDGYGDILIGASAYPGFYSRQGRILVYYGSDTGPDGDPDFIADGETNNSRFGNSVGTAGDVNGDGFSDLIVGAPNYPNNGAQGRVYLYSPGMGRPVKAGQIRDDGSGVPVQTWGISYDVDGFIAQIHATDPRGQGNVKLEVEACLADVPFGDASCTEFVAPDWTATGLSGVVLEEELTGLSSDMVYAWRARVVYDSHSNPYGPWRRYLASSLRADLRVGTPPDVAIDKAVAPAIAGPGQVVTYTLVFSNGGSLAAPQVVITDHVPVTLTNVHYAATRPVTPTGVVSCTWEVGSLDANESGIITVTGVVSSDVTGVFDLTNEAVIAAVGVVDGDPDNSTSTASSTVDADPPEIVAVYPADEAEAVALGASVVITFGEAIDAETLAYTVAPDPGGWAAVWNGAGSVMTMTHGMFDAGETYTFTVTAADDLVGNTLENAPYEWSFETASYQIYLPVVLKE